MTGSLAPATTARPPLYARLLHLRHIQLTGWQGALLGEGVLILAVVLVLADLASAWTLLVLPLAVAGVVTLHDMLAGLLAPAHRDGTGTQSAPDS